MQVVASVPGGGAGAAAQHGGHAAGQGFFDLLRADEWMWLSMPPAVTMLPSQLMTSVPGPMMMSTPGRVGVACLADGGDAALRPGRYRPLTMPVWSITRALVSTVSPRPVGALALGHAVADGFAAAKLHLFAVAACAQGVSRPRLRGSVGVGQAQ